MRENQFIRNVRVTCHFFCRWNCCLWIRREFGCPWSRPNLSASEFPHVHLSLPSSQCCGEKEGGQRKRGGGKNKKWVMKLPDAAFLQMPPGKVLVQESAFESTHREGCSYLMIQLRCVVTSSLILCDSTQQFQRSKGNMDVCCFLTLLLSVCFTVMILTADLCGFAYGGADSLPSHNNEKAPSAVQWPAGTDT